jgi:hypothetical protein
MYLTPEQVEGLDTALNEATLLHLEMERDRRAVTITFSVLTLPHEDGTNPPEDPHVQILLSPIGLVAASLRTGRWNDASAAVVPFALEHLREVVQSFGCLPVYGGGDMPPARQVNVTFKRAQRVRSIPARTIDLPLE